MLAGSRVARAILVGVLAAAIAGAAWATGALDQPERDLLDARYDVRGSQGPPPDVVVVAIDEDTFSELGFPFARRNHVRVIRRLLDAGARKVVYDVQFSEPSASRRADRELARLSRDPRVVFGTGEVLTDGRPRVLPGIQGAGFALLPVDGDGVIRDMQGTLHGVPLLAVLGAAAEAHLGRRPIDFHGPAGTVRQYGFQDAIAGRIPPAAIRGKVVVVGATAPDLHDLHATAVGNLMPGPEINANAIQTILDGYPLKDTGLAVGIVLLIAAAFAAPVATLPRRPFGPLARGLVAGALGLAVLLAGAQLAFDSGWIVPVAPPVLALVLGTLGAVAATYATEVRARRRMRAAFARFVPPAVVDEIVERDGVPPRRIEATVMFCDLRGFTTLAEGLAPDQVIEVLNRYLSMVSGAVFDHGGTVVSYQGDGVMAVFGAPLEQPDHPARALAAARQIAGDGLPQFNRWLHDHRLSDRTLDVGIGLNTGPVMSGSVGSERRLEYAAVGDATNVAARLQALSRDTTERIFVAASTVEKLGDDMGGLRRFGEIKLRGRTEPVTVYALHG
jgi:adenylate cyclase